MYHFIDACDICGEFHKVSLQEVDGTTYVACDYCLDELYEQENSNLVVDNDD
jgi:hypothetical protein